MRGLDICSILLENIRCALLASSLTTGRACCRNDAVGATPGLCGSPPTPAQGRLGGIAAPLLLRLQTAAKPLLVSCKRLPNHHVEASPSYSPPGAFLAGPRRADPGETRLSA